MTTYILAAVAATLALFLLPAWNVSAARRALAALGLLVLGPLAGCNEGGLLVVEDAGGGGATTSTSPTTTTSLTPQLCSPACAPPKVCGGGCGTGWGCYLPGGNPVDPGPNDCPACFPAPSSAPDVCNNTAYPIASWCQAGAEPTGGCIMGGALRPEHARVRLLHVLPSAARARWRPLIRMPRRTGPPRRPSRRSCSRSRYRASTPPA